jgi:hypothetical protein
MTSSLIGDPWAASSEGYGYITTGVADKPYSASYKVPGTIQNYYCRQFRLATA